MGFCPKSMATGRSSKAATQRCAAGAAVRRLCACAVATRRLLPLSLPWFHSVASRESAASPPPSRRRQRAVRMKKALSEAGRRRRPVRPCTPLPPHTCLAPPSAVLGSSRSATPNQSPSSRDPRQPALVHTAAGLSPCTSTRWSPCPATRRHRLLVAASWS
jgi:hypothetical protein